jgi:hypothetical protein
VAVQIFSIGPTRKDGLFVLAGYALMVVAMVIVRLGVHGFALGWSQVHAWLLDRRKRS